MSISQIPAALKLAAHGYPVFPCSDPSKKPATPNGFKDATTDIETIKRLWRDHPGGLIGVCTGEVIGLDVLDLDFGRHHEARDWWQENRQRVPRTRTHRTRSGGLHLLFQHDDRVHCTAGKLRLGVDTRGNGGYIIWWPAAGLPVLSAAPLAAWPDWLSAEFLPKRRSASTTTSTVPFCDDGWLRGLVRTVAGAAEGQRNTILFWAACRAGDAVRNGRAVETFVVDVLVEAATHAGLPQTEAQRTIQSGLRRK
jgi:hypothetical protein